jgi:methyltransferase
MVTPLRAYAVLLVLLAGQRLGELALSRRNVRRLRERGGIEAGARHYPPMVAMHALFFVACAIEAARAPAPPPAGLAAAALLVLLLAQGLRWWAILSLGDRWTTSIVTVPGEAPVVEGPYRFLRHPNYLAVVLEFAAVPLVYGSWRTALVFGLLNAVVLSVRIGVEERALGGEWQRAFRGRPRFVPGRRRDVA